MGKSDNVFTLLDEIHHRPGMFVSVHTGADLLPDIERMLHGYYVALAHHGIVEDVPHMGHHFMIWVHVRTGYSCSAGWAYAIAEHVQDPSSRLAKFFELVGEFRRLRRRLVATNTPSEQRADGVSRVELYVYEPAGVYFAITHSTQPRVGWLLMDRCGNYTLSAPDARRLAGEHEGLRTDEWREALTGVGSG